MFKVRTILCDASIYSILKAMDCSKNFLSILKAIDCSKTITIISVSIAQQKSDPLYYFRFI